MLTENDIEKLNSAKVGDVVELEDGRKITPTRTHSNFSCNQCELVGDGCGNVRCVSRNIIYKKAGQS